MHIFTQSTAFLTTDDHRPSVVSFLTSLRYIFNSSVIPEILSSNVDKELFKKLVLDCKEKSSWYRLFARCDTMQFSPTLIIPSGYCSSSSSSSSVSPDHDDDDNDENPPDGFMEEVLLPLKKNMRYFSCSLQRCEIHDRDLQEDRGGEGILALLADVRSLTHLELQNCDVGINEFLSLFLASSSRNQLEQLTMGHRRYGGEVDLPEGIEGCFFRRLRCLKLCNVEHESALKLLKHCPNLRTLIISNAAWVLFDKIFDLVPKLTTLEVNRVNYKVSELSNLCDKLPVLTSLDLVSAYGDSQLHNIDFLYEKPLMHDKLRVIKVELSGEERRIWYDPQKGHWNCIMDGLCHFQNLTQLDLSNFDRQLNDDNFDHFAYLGSLRQFRVVNAEVTSYGLFVMALWADPYTHKRNFFTNLETLEFSNCKLGGTKRSPRDLVKFFSCCKSNKLEVLQLEDANLVDADLTPELVAEWKRCGVKTLWLSRNPGLSYSNNNDDDVHDDRERKKNDLHRREPGGFYSGGHTYFISFDNPCTDEKNNGLVNLSQLTSITNLNISHLVNVQGLDFLANMQQLRELDVSFMPNLKSSAMKVFTSPHHQDARNSFLMNLRKIYLRKMRPQSFSIIAPPQDSFPHLRKIHLESSCTSSGVPADEVLELLLENENIKLRLQELNLRGMSFSERFDALQKQFKGLEYFDFRVRILEPPPGFVSKTITNVGSMLGSVQRFFAGGY